jgi:hypothetical protein
MNFIRQVLDAIADVRAEPGRSEEKEVTRSDVAMKLRREKSFLSPSKEPKRKGVIFEKLLKVRKRYADTTREERYELSCRDDPPSNRAWVDFVYFKKRGPKVGSKYKKRSKPRSKTKKPT